MKSRHPRRRKPSKQSLFLPLSLVGVAGCVLIWFTIMFTQTASSQTNDPQPSFSPPLSATVLPSPPPTSPVSASPYDYSAPVPASPMVERSYFDDAVFIGDSRTEGLLLYTGLTNATGYTYKGLMVDTVFTKPVIQQNGTLVSVMDALKTTSFSKVYIMLGINEMGWPYPSVFAQQYAQIIDAIRDINPTATIYIQEIFPVSYQVSTTHSYISNEKIQEFNQLLQQLALEKQVYYVDVSKALVDDTGCLPSEAAADGIHLTKTYCELWLNYLQTHTISQ